MNDQITYEVVTQEDPETGDLILTLPQELLDKMGWTIGDKINWKQSTTGEWLLEKVSD